MFFINVHCNLIKEKKYTHSAVKLHANFRFGNRCLKKEMSAGILLSILLFVRLLIIARGLDNDFTVDIPAGAQSCFFETIKTKSTEFEVEYQVIINHGFKTDANSFFSFPMK